MTKLIIVVADANDASSLIGQFEWARLQVGSDQAVNNGMRYMVVDVPAHTNVRAVEAVIAAAGKTILARQ